MSLYRIRNIVIAAVLIIASFILETTIVSKIPVFECAPNILLIITFAYGYINGKIPGMLVGFFGGLLIDIFYCDVLGYNAMILVIIGFISGIWNSYFYSDDLYIPLLIIVGSDLLYCLAYYICWFLLRAKFSFGYYLIHEIFPELLLTFIAAIIIYKPVSLLLDKLKFVPEE